MSFGALTPEQQQAIHDSSMQILRRVGVRVDNEEIRRQLAEAGADVDGSGGSVRMPESWLRPQLEACPKSVSLGGRGAEPRVDRIELSWRKRLLDERHGEG